MVKQSEQLEEAPKFEIQDMYGTVIQKDALQKNAQEYEKKRETLLKEREKKISVELQTLRSHLEKHEQNLYSDDTYNKLALLAKEIVVAKTAKDKIERTRDYYDLSETIRKRTASDIPPHLTQEMETKLKNNGNELYKTISPQKKALTNKYEKEIKDAIVKEYKEEFNKLNKEYNVPSEPKGAYIPEGVFKK